MRIEALRVYTYKFPTEQQPCESDGTLEWSSTTMVLVELVAGGKTGIGYTYANGGAAEVIESMLRDEVVAADPMETGKIFNAMVTKIRNNGRGGISAMAVSAVDIALWDLKAKLLEMPLCRMLAQVRNAVPVYGSGGFTSYSVDRLRDQLGGWAHDLGLAFVKMKVGRDPAEDPRRVAAARRAIGSGAQLFVDANGAYSVKQALALAQSFAEEEVTWFEEPVYHNDLAGNAFVAQRAPAGMEISNGEYGYAPYQFREILEKGAADVLQADVTRCGGVTGFLAVDALCDAYNVPLSSHCAPYATLHVGTAAKRLRHAEYFHDHVRIEQTIFDGASAPQNGALVPDSSRPGIGLEFKKQDAERLAA